MNCLTVIPPDFVSFSDLLVDGFLTRTHVQSGSLLRQHVFRRGLLSCVDDKRTLDLGVEITMQDLIICRHYLMR